MAGSKKSLSTVLVTKQQLVSECELQTRLGTRHEVVSASALTGNLSPREEKCMNVNSFPLTMYIGLTTPKIQPLTAFEFFKHV